MAIPKTLAIPTASDEIPSQKISTLDRPQTRSVQFIIIRRPDQTRWPREQFAQFKTNSPLIHMGPCFCNDCITRRYVELPPIDPQTAFVSSPEPHIPSSSARSSSCVSPTPLAH